MQFPHWLQNTKQAPAHTPPTTAREHRSLLDMLAIAAGPDKARLTPRQARNRRRSRAGRKASVQARKKC